MWQSAGSRPSASRAITSGSSPNGDAPVSSASKAGSRSRSSASARRCAVVRRPRRAAATAPTWLALMPRRLEWKAPPRDSCDRLVAVPAQLDDRGIRGEQVQRELQPERRRAGMEDDVLAAGRVLGPREVDSERGCGGRPALRSTSTSVTCDARDAADQPGDAAADHAGADDRDPVADQRRGVPQGVDGGLHGPGEHGPLGRDPVRHHGHRIGRHDVRRLMREQAEDRAPDAARRGPARPRRR